MFISVHETNLEKVSINMEKFLLGTLVLITFIRYSEEQFLNDTRFPLSFQIDLEDKKENEEEECQRGISHAIGKWNEFVCPNGFRQENIFDACCLGCSIGDVWFREQKDCKIEGEGLASDAMRQCCEKYKSEAIQFARDALNLFLQKHKRPENFDQLDKFFPTEELTRILTFAYKDNGGNIQDILEKTKYINVIKDDNDDDERKDEDYEIEKEYIEND